MPIGVQSSVYSYNDLTQGCYCQYAHGTFDTDNGWSYRPLTDMTLVTRCSPDYSTWWDGTAAMNTTGGAIPGDPDPTDPIVEYNLMQCSKNLALTSLEAPSGQATLVLYDWPTASQAHSQVTLPSNVVLYPDGPCDGYDVQNGMEPNGQRSSFDFTANNVVNCTCHGTLYSSDLSNRPSDMLHFNTCCDKTLLNYYNGQGYRKVRDQAKLNLAGTLAVSDTCTAGVDRTASTNLVYVRGTSSGGGGNGGNGLQDSAVSVRMNLALVTVSLLVVVLVLFL